MTIYVSFTILSDAQNSTLTFDVSLLGISAQFHVNLYNGFFVPSIYKSHLVGYDDGFIRPLSSPFLRYSCIDAVSLISNTGIDDLKFAGLTAHDIPPQPSLCLVLPFLSVTVKSQQPPVSLLVLVLKPTKE